MRGCVKITMFARNVRVVKIMQCYETSILQYFEFWKFENSKNTILKHTLLKYFKIDGLRAHFGKSQRKQINDLDWKVQIQTRIFSELVIIFRLPKQNEREDPWQI